jgi:hypothetical protein
MQSSKRPSSSILLDPSSQLLWPGAVPPTIGRLTIIKDLSFAEIYAHLLPPPLPILTRLTPPNHGLMHEQARSYVFMCWSFFINCNSTRCQASDSRHSDRLLLNQKCPGKAPGETADRPDSMVVLCNGRNLRLWLWLCLLACSLCLLPPTTDHRAPANENPSDHF